MASKIEVVHKFKDGRAIVKIKTKLGDKYAFVKDNDFVKLRDTDGDLSGIEFFDGYKVNEDGEVIIKVFKRPDEWLRVLGKFDLSEAQATITEVPGGPFNIGPYAKQYYEYKGPTKTIDDIIPGDLKYSHGLVNSEGILSIYPQFDKMSFAGEGACIVGNLFVLGDCRFGYVDCATGKALTPMDYEEARPFSEERAAVKYKGKYGFIDRNKIITDPKDNDQYPNSLSPRYYRVTDFKDGVTTVVVSTGTIWSPPTKMNLDRDGNYVRMVHNKEYMKNKR